jgi:alcohol dehydrogenase YqhD (iron-dependent ADH family)
MATRHRITCINKRGNHYDAHERIAKIGGINPNHTRWTLTEDEAIKSIEEKKYEFYVSVGGKDVDVIISTHDERKYLKTQADGYSPNNLLSLDECPAV